MHYSTLKHSVFVWFLGLSVSCLLLISPKTATAKTYLVDAFDTIDGEWTLREAVDDACHKDGDDTIIFDYCAEKSKTISLSSAITLSGCKGSITVDNGATYDVCKEPDASLAVQASPNATSLPALFVISSANDIVIQGLVLQNSPGAAVQIKGSSSRITLTYNTYKNNTKGVELAGNGSSVDIFVGGSKFSNSPDQFIVRTNPDTNRGTDVPSDLAAYIDNKQLSLRGKIKDASDSDKWRVGMYSYDTGKKLYVQKNSYDVTGKDIDHDFDDTSGFQVNSSLYILTHYQKNENRSTGVFSKEVVVDDEAPEPEPEPESCTTRPCNGETTLQEELILDLDQDGYTIDEDCNDADPTIHPGAIEVCDDKDNNCDGQIDEGHVTCFDLTPILMPPPGTCTSPSTFYQDADGDGYGTDTSTALSCEAPTGYVSTAGDCNDSDATVHPTATETCGDGVDQDCSGADSSCPEDDADGDGYTESQGDCDDNDPSIHPGAAEACDAIDSDCDGDTSDGCEICDAEFYRDQDADSYGDPDVSYTGCSAKTGYVSDGSDCDDTNATIHPTATETCEDSRDNDCDGDVDEGCEEPKIDADGDTYGSDIDCNDNDPAINPGATEIPGNGVDENCDGTDEPPTTGEDDDEDGFVDEALGGNDCDDTDAAINPAATDIPLNGIDENCDGSDSDDDMDDDGYIAISADGDDCDDSDPTINPAAEEIIDGLDNDCDFQVDEDPNPPPKGGDTGGCSLVAGF